MAASQSNEPSFEEMLEQLDALVERLETGGLTLEESLQAYEAAVNLVATCQQTLDQAEVRITSIEAAVLEGAASRPEIS